MNNQVQVFVSESGSGVLKVVHNNDTWTMTGFDREGNELETFQTNGLPGKRALNTFLGNVQMRDLLNELSQYLRDFSSGRHEMSQTFYDPSGKSVNAHHSSTGQWTITAFDQNGQPLDVLIDNNSPSDDAIRIFLTDTGTVGLISELPYYVKRVMLRYQHGNGYPAA